MLIFLGNFVFGSVLVLLISKMVLLGFYGRGYYQAKKELTMRKFGNSEFSTKPTKYYNLDVVIFVGYRGRAQTGV